MEPQPSKTTLYVGIGFIILAIIGVIIAIKKPPVVDTQIQSENQIESIIQPIDQTGNNVLPNSNEPASSAEIKKIMHTATITTNLGSMTIQLSPETAPKTVANFEKLANEGFYNGVRFHRVIKDFMIQAGDPNSKDTSKKSIWGTGGPGYKFDDELTSKETYPQGTLAMANAGPNTNGSQFFIVTANPAPLPPSYTVFGKVIKGMDVALKIENVKTETADRPIDDVVIEKITIE
jgi:cyclophilin family peptidyl-prolyl cis-trans isomerase